MTAKFGDALRGYAHMVLKRDGYICRYCGLDGTIWPNWLYLSWDHLMPVGHPERNDPSYIVAACRFCNEASNRTKWDVAGKSRRRAGGAKEAHCARDSRAVPRNLVGRSPL